MENQEPKKPGFNTLVIDGVTYETLLTDKYKNRTAYKEADPKEIRAFIPGTVVEIFVKNRRKVKEGDTLLILEAMKMRNQVVAPITGTIKKLHIKQMDIVSKNQLMIEME